MKRKTSLPKSAGSVALAFDLGGTDLKSGIVDRQGHLLYSTRTPSCAQQSSAAVLENILASFKALEKRALEKKQKIVGVGIGIPGIVSHPQGIVHSSPHFLFWKDFPIKKILRRAIPYPLVLDNDANFAALGEAWKGRGKNKKNFILLTLGTGIGGGIILNHQIFRGDSGFAGEIGHLVLDPEGDPCSCGGRGCLERYASASGLKARYEAMSLRGKNPKRSAKKDGTFFSAGLDSDSTLPEKLCRLAREGNREACQLYQELGNALGVGIATLANILGIELIVLGGGLSESWDLFISALHKALREHLYPATVKRLKIQRAKLKNNAGLLGAAREAFQTESNEPLSEPFL